MPLTLRQFALIALPLLLVPCCVLVFRWLGRRFDPPRAYWLGFAFYWLLWCIAFPLMLLGPGELLRAFRIPVFPAGPARWLLALLLAGPVIGSALMNPGFAGQLRRMPARSLAPALAFALVNGTLEELLWRGAFLNAFPDIWAWGLLLPSIGFGLWHLAPQQIYPAGPTPWPFALMSIFLGGAFGVASLILGGAILPAVIAHILLDLIGVAGMDFIRTP